MPPSRLLLLVTLLVALLPSLAGHARGAGDGGIGRPLVFAPLPMESP